MLSRLDMLEEALCNALAIALDVYIPTLVAVGHPAQELPPHGKHDRFDRTKVHYGRWRELKLSEEAEKGAR
ncbi:MAG: hypothetical protein FJ014_09025 [Chloroflexi bacterium]|nr:hypothetical protein [Chloroflexota bacterium]